MSGVKPSGLPPGFCPASGGANNAGPKAGGKPEGLAPHRRPLLCRPQSNPSVAAMASISASLTCTSAFMRAGSGRSSKA